MESTKVCTKCEKEQSTTEFYKDGRRTDGLRSWCKSCTAVASALNEGKYKETRKAYRESQHGKTVSAVAHRKRYAEKKDLILEQNAAWRQTKKGRLNSYQNSAKLRGYEWSLTDDQFFNYWQKPCTYCGSDIETVGLDRIDSKGGYIVDNVTACCSVCNKMKLDLTKKDFIGKMKQILKHIGE